MKFEGWDCSHFSSQLRCIFSGVRECVTFEGYSQLISFFPVVTSGWDCSQFTHSFVVVSAEFVNAQHLKGIHNTFQPILKDAEVGTALSLAHSFVVFSMEFVNA
ncbi:hypothetical protein [Riemerella anatipestifer]|uniref:hypothetical protein n=1 Tax=Riemerella anatipestifer TaxID=34085 RepID=UPI001BDB06E7|nr:hypothetical protein [Riemerella anatipestifer]MBT0550326.1 hypothetical protein [Riemerella anatipestifer]MBT0561086.1 hypothetical protein [Riemerella anatipestifer]MCW0509897.1 hypothetical protein [Riemerella anatipestifer]